MGLPVGGAAVVAGQRVFGQPMTSRPVNEAVFFPPRMKSDTRTSVVSRRIVIENIG